MRGIDAAMTEVVLAAYPTATLKFFTRDGQRRFKAETGAHVGPVFDAVAARATASHSPLGSGSGQVAPKSYLDCPLASQPVWRALYASCGPSRSTVPGAYPRCWFSPAPATGAAQHSGLCPAWTPHAVAYIGGFEGADLRRSVLPAFAEHVPRLPEGTGDLPPGMAQRRVETVRGRRREPSYYQSKFFERDLLRDKGCAAYGSSLLELSLPTGTGGDHHRERVFLGLANTSVTLTELVREADPARRSQLRGAFGCSLPLLQQALPRPVAAAAMLIREREAAAGRPEVTSAFWVSAIARLVTMRGCSLVDDAARDCQSDAVAARVAERLRHNGDTPAARPSSTAADEEECWLTEQLASAALGYTGRCTDAEWSEHLQWNFFLPDESFSNSSDVAQLACTRRELAAPVFQAPSRPGAAQAILGRLSKDLVL